MYSTILQGLFHSNMRWGPGIESHACLKADVGLWRGTQLIRLAWRPEAPSIAPDLYATSIGRACVDPHRVMLVTSYKNVSSFQIYEFNHRHQSGPVILTHVCLINKELAMCLGPQLYV